MFVLFRLGDFVLLIVSRRPSEEHDELIDLVNQYSDEEEVELMARSMADQFPDVSDNVVTAIHEIQERSQLDELFDQILTAKTFDDIDFSRNGN